jgi:hypothetical protein
MFFTPKLTNQKQKKKKNDWSTQVRSEIGRHRPQLGSFWKLHKILLVWAFWKYDMWQFEHRNLKMGGLSTPSQATDRIYVKFLAPKFTSIFKRIGGIVN